MEIGTRFWRIFSETVRRGALELSGEAAHGSAILPAFTRSSRETRFAMLIASHLSSLVSAGSILPHTGYDQGTTPPA